MKLTGMVSMHCVNAALSLPKSCVVALFCCVLLLGSVAAQTTVSPYWLGGNGNWYNNASWNTGIAPNNTATTVYNVTINPSTPSNVELDYPQSATVNSLLLGPQVGLAVAGGVLDVRNDLVNTGGLGVSHAGIVAIGGDLTNSDVINTIGGSQLIVNGDVNNSNYLQTSEGSFRVAGDLNNSGLFDNGAFSLNLATVGGNLNNGGTVESGPKSPIIVAGAINNSGKLLTYSDSASSLNNSGSVAAYGSNAFGSVNNSGVLANFDTITATGEVLNSGTIEMGVGTTINAASFSQSTTGLWLEDFYSPSAFGALNLTGGLNLAGTLDFNFLNGFMVSLGDTFAMANFAPGQLTGSFSSILDNSFNNGLWMFDIDYDNTDGHILLTVVNANGQPTSTPEPGTWAMLIAIPMAVVVLRRKLNAPWTVPLVSSRCTQPLKELQTRKVVIAT